MKKILLVVITAILNYTALAQDFQGIAVYESKTTVNDFSATATEGMDHEMERQIKEQLSKALEKKYMLRFNKSSSLYQEEERLDGPAPGSGAMVQVSFSGGGRLYKNLKDKTYITERDLFSKEFLIADSLKKPEWKLENETKKIGSYNCYKATYTIKPRIVKEEEEQRATNITQLGAGRETTVTAWYTPEIPVSHGPANYWGLPGLILEVNDGRTTLLCSKITLNPKEKLEISAPKKGKKVTQKEFDKVLDEKIKEMDDMHGRPGPGDRGNTIIKIGG